MKNSKIIVSNPCNKDWSKMSSTENGRHCISCNKTVIDFSNWEIEDIKNYLKDTDKNVCGSFKSLQVIVKRPRHHQFLVNAYFQTKETYKSSYLKSFLLCSILVCMFIVGCNNPSETQIKGKVPMDKNHIDSKECKTDEPNHRTTGVIAPKNRQDRIDTLNETTTRQIENNKK
jgi:hypothetical protein